MSASWQRWAVCVALLAASCDGGAPRAMLPDRSPHSSPTGSDTILIGLVATLSGPGSWRGEDAFEGADLAVHVTNRALEEGEPAFELTTLDDRGDPARATELLEQLAASERVAGIVYAGPPQGLPPAAPALEAAGIPAFICYGDLYGAGLLRRPLFQTSPSFVWQARRIAAYLLRDRRYERVGALVESSLMGTTAARALKSAFVDEAHRAPVVLRYTHRDFAARTLLARLRQARVQALVVEGTPEIFTRVFRALDEMGATYATTRRARASRRRTAAWRPQVAGFDLLIGPGTRNVPPGTVAAETYARGAHYLPIPSFVRFRRAFSDWWDSAPLGWERRAFEAARLIAWARARTGQRGDLIDVLERARGLRVGGLDVTFGPDDHTSVDQGTVGLWVVPSRRARVPERADLPEELPWVMLARGFSIDGEDTDLLAEDWRWMVRRPPPRRAPPPPLNRVRFGVASGRSDPVH